MEAAGAAVQWARVRAPPPPPPRPHSPLSSGDMAFEGDPLALAGGNGVAAAAGATPPRMPLTAAAKALYHLAAAFAAKGPPLSARAAHLLSLPPLGVPPTLTAAAADLRAAGATTSEVAVAAGGVGATLLAGCSCGGTWASWASMGTLSPPWVRGKGRHPPPRPEGRFRDTAGGVARYGTCGNSDVHGGSHCLS